MGAIGALKKAVFANSEWPIGRKRVIYGVTVLEVLLYGAENWTPRQRDPRRLARVIPPAIYTHGPGHDLGGRARWTSTCQAFGYSSGGETWSRSLTRSGVVVSNGWVTWLAWVIVFPANCSLVPCRLNVLHLFRGKYTLKHGLAAVFIGKDEWLDTANDRSE